MISYEPFYNTLKQKGITSYKLITKYNVSRGLLDRLKHNKPITTVTLNDLCNILDCNVNDIIIFIKDVWFYKAERLMQKFWVKYFACAKCEIIYCVNCEILTLSKWNEINPPTPTGISQIPQGIYFVEKTTSIRLSFFLVSHRRFELRTTWLKVKCSANWANGP